MRRLVWAVDTLVLMPAQGSSAATLHSPKCLQLLITGLKVPDTVCPWHGRCRPPRWPALMKARPMIGATTLVDVGELQFFDGVGTWCR